MHPKKSRVYTIKLKKIQVPNLKNKSRFTEPEFFLGFKIDLDFSRPLFSEIMVQIKRPSESTRQKNGNIHYCELHYITL